LLTISKKSLPDDFRFTALVAQPRPSRPAGSEVWLNDSIAERLDIRAKVKVVKCRDNLRRRWEFLNKTGVIVMAYVVDFETVSTVGLESSPVADALAGLRAHEARYFKNKYAHTFTVEPAGKAKKTIKYVENILKTERDIVIQSPPLEATTFEVENITWAYVFYESGLSINVLYTIDDSKKRAVGFKLSLGMDIPAELATKFKFARQKSKLAGEIRGSYFVIKGEY
jgi:hypothetical protein